MISDTIGGPWALITAEERLRKAIVILMYDDGSETSC